KTISEQMPKGDPYSDVTKVISINILYFDFGIGDDYIYHGTTRFIGLHDHRELELSEKQKTLYTANKIADIYPEYYLIEIRNFDDIAKDTLDEWIYFLKNETIEDNFTAKGLQKAQETLNVLKMKAPERQDYERHQAELHREASLYESTYVLGKIEGKKEGKKEGKQEGREEGREEERLIMARNMKRAKMDNQVIAEITKLSIEVIGGLS
ncbi:MAG: PD-(D/E)XK nuclease family transposase, partial [Methylococcales bacterium]|nr:PD-(D/E)XK nuclease family transposase [Methylococcales bacterium]